MALVPRIRFVSRISTKSRVPPLGAVSDQVTRWSQPARRVPTLTPSEVRGASG